MMKLSEYLKDKGIKQAAFAAKVGCSRSLMSLILSGDRRPTLDMALAIQRETNGEVQVEVWDRHKQDGDAAPASQGHVFHTSGPFLNADR